MGRMEWNGRKDGWMDGIMDGMEGMEWNGMGRMSGARLLLQTQWNHKVDKEPK